MAAVLTNGGRAGIVSRMLGNGTEPKYLGVGTGVGTAAVADTTLFTETASDLSTTTGTRITGTTSAYTTSVAGDTYRAIAVFTATAGGSITNVGTWDAATIGAGTLYTHFDFTSIGLGAADTATFDIRVVIG